MSCRLCGAWILIALVGCLDKVANDCGDGVVCPLDKVCLVGGGCALPDQVSACEGRLEGEGCTFAGGVGTCMDGVCIGTSCGNSELDAGETCDGDAGVDTAAGQRCSADCLRIEFCGNGVL